MTNKEHVEVLKQGVLAWNEWRVKIYPVKPDLCGADLRGVNLRGIERPGVGLSMLLNAANLRGADLSDTNLSRVDLFGAELREANLYRANLSGANLEEAVLFKADLREADLSEANLCKADLREAILDKANLRMISLNNSGVNGANLAGNDLSKAKLRGAYLTETNLYQANLHKADLREAVLSWSDLTEADLSETDLSGARLNRTHLVGANLKNATLTGACLYGTSRDNWNIDNIKCDFIFWDEKTDIPPYFNTTREEQVKQWEQEHRVPKDRDFLPGEFEELYRHLPTFDYVFERGIQILDMAIIDCIVNEFNELHPEWELKIDSFQARSLPRAVFSLREKHLVTDVFQQIKTKYEAMLNRLEGERDALERAHHAFMHEAIHRPQNVISAEKVVMGDENHTTAGRDYLKDVNGSDVMTGKS